MVRRVRAPQTLWKDLKSCEGLMPHVQESCGSVYGVTPQGVTALEQSPCGERSAGAQGRSQDCSIGGAGFQILFSSPREMVENRRSESKETVYEYNLSCM